MVRAEYTAGYHARHYFGIFAVACATLSYQILITRFFSVVLYYHFAFAAISFAMLGLTRGAMTVYRNPTRYSPDNVDEQFGRHASLFAFGAVVVMIAFLTTPLLVPVKYLTPVLSLEMLAFVLPFTDSGVCITLLLTRLPYRGGRLYAADLSGAAVGCVGIILVLFIIDPVSATLWISVVAAGAGWVVARGSTNSRAVRLPRNVTVTLAALAMLHTAGYLTGRGNIGVIWAKGGFQLGTLFERWNTFSRIRVKSLGHSTPFGWGMPTRPQTKIDQLYLDIDADASTVITRWDNDVNNVGYLKTDVINAAYQIRPVQDVAVVGVGGGRDILSALVFGAGRVTGVEINPAIFEVLNDKFADFSGHLGRQSGVSLINAEARSYINHSADRHDLIQISLIDTWAATAAGGLTLTENRLYTVEAWDDFYRALKPNGMLSVSRWFNSDVHRDELYRLLAIAAEALKRRGVPARELSKHVIAVNAKDIVTVITSPAAFTDAEWQQARERLTAQGFTILLGPDVRFDTVTSPILSGDADETFFRELPQNIAPSTDNKPFFFYTSRLGDLLTTNPFGMRNANGAVLTTLLLVIIAFIACLSYVVVPLIRMSRRAPISTVAPPVIFFCAIGMGFMLIEISQMQRLMVFLGHPVYGLGVVLFTLLLSSGIGSMTVSSGNSSRDAIIWRVAGLLAAIVLVGALTPVVTHATRTAPTGARILLSVLLLTPPGFFMGMMFPLGLGVWRRHSELLPFFWAANGVMSVFASVLGMALSMEFGIAQTFAIGALFYAVAAITATRRSLQTNR
jgi:spermidine synthase